MMKKAVHATLAKRQIPLMNTALNEPLSLFVAGSDITVALKG